jgi:hypothetical protein
MPIQFRCGSCQQLLGIAKRKAGAIVDCPTCRQKTRVPIIKENVAPPPPSKELTNKPVSIFDRVDVEKLLSPPVQKEPREKGARKPISLAESLGPLVPDDTPPDPLVGIHAQATNNKETDVINDGEPFTLTASAQPSPRSAAKWKFVALLCGSAILIAGLAFFIGHWVGGR